MCRMMDNLEQLEVSIYVLKAMLKEPDFRTFEDLKIQTIMRI